MRNKIITGAAISVAVITLVVGYRLSVSPAVAADTTEYTVKAIQLGKWIDDGSAAYQAAKAEKEAYEKKAKASADQMARAALTNAGLRLSLCNEFRLMRSSGSFLPVPEGMECMKVASFQ